MAPPRDRRPRGQRNNEQQQRESTTRGKAGGLDAIDPRNERQVRRELRQAGKSAASSPLETSGQNFQKHTCVFAFMGWSGAKPDSLRGALTAMVGDEVGSH